MTAAEEGPGYLPEIKEGVWPWGAGLRKNGVYEMPGQFIYDGLRCYPTIIPAELDRIKNDLELNENDVISVAYPKTGSTWVNNLIFLVCNNVNVELHKSLSPIMVIPFLEFNLPGMPLAVDALEAMTTERLMKSHLPLRYFQRNLDKLDKSPKFVVATRNPKDTLVSLYHHYKIDPVLGLFDGDWNEFFELFREKQLLYEDIFSHTSAWWGMQDHPHVHFIKYEELIKDTAGAIRELANFLGRPFSDAQIKVTIEATTLHTFQNNVNVHPAFINPDDPDRNFFRKGKVGGWQEYFTEEQSDYIDQMCQKQYDPIGLDYEYLPQNAE